MNCQDATLSLGVYLLGALEPAERAEVDVHLRDCTACQRELAELAGLPSILEQLDIEEIEPHGGAAGSITPSPDLFERVATRARDEETRRRSGMSSRYRRLTAVAAAVAVLTGVGIGAVVASQGGHGTASTTVSADRGPVHMKVTLTSQRAGTTLDVAVAGLPENEHCWLVAYANDGSHHLAFQWESTYGGRAHVTGSTQIPMDQLSKLVLLGSHHQPLDEVAV